MAEKRPEGAMTFNVSGNEDRTGHSYNQVEPEKKLKHNGLYVIPVDADKGTLLGCASLDPRIRRSLEKAVPMLGERSSKAVAYNRGTAGEWRAVLIAVRRGGRTLTPEATERIMTRAFMNAWWEGAGSIYVDPAVEPPSAPQGWLHDVVYRITSEMAIPYNTSLGGWDPDHKDYASVPKVNLQDLPAASAVPDTDHKDAVVAPARTVQGADMRTGQEAPLRPLGQREEAPSTPVVTYRRHDWSARPAAPSAPAPSAPAATAATARTSSLVHLAMRGMGATEAAVQTAARAYSPYEVMAELQRSEEGRAALARAQADISALPPSAEVVDAWSPRYNPHWGYPMAVMGDVSLLDDTSRHVSVDGNHHLSELQQGIARGHMANMADTGLPFDPVIVTGGAGDGAWQGRELARTRGLPQIRITGVPLADLVRYSSAVSLPLDDPQAVSMAMASSRRLEGTERHFGGQAALPREVKYRTAEGDWGTIPFVSGVSPRDLAATCGMLGAPSSLIMQPLGSSSRSHTAQAASMASRAITVGIDARHRFEMGLGHDVPLLYMPVTDDDHTLHDSDRYEYRDRSPEASLRAWGDAGRVRPRIPVRRMPHDPCM